MDGNVSLRLRVDEFRSMTLMPTLIYKIKIHTYLYNSISKTPQQESPRRQTVVFVYLPLPDNALEETPRQCTVNEAVRRPPVRINVY